MIDYRVYIEGQLLDMFEDETVKITDSIKDAKDVGSIFTEYSQQISVPASRNNNDIFKNFYNYDIINGFDARQKRPAEIQINGQTWKRGFIELMGVKLKEDKPQNYKIVFRGELSKLKDIVGDVKLNELTQLSNYDHANSFDNARKGFRNFLKVDANNETTTIADQSNGSDEICYPFITHSKRYAYKNGNLFEVDKETGNVTTNELAYQQLKPAIKLQLINDAIEDKFGLTFNSPFFDGYPFRGLYMWLHRDEGFLSSDSFVNIDLYRNDFVNVPQTSPSDQDFWNNQGFFFTEFDSTTEKTLQLNYAITFVGDGEVSIQIENNINGNLFVDETINVDNETINYSIDLQSDFNNIDYYQPIVKVETESSTINTVDVQLSAQSLDLLAGPQSVKTAVYEIEGGARVAINYLNVLEQIPEMKVIDYLTSIFKMFNLVGYVNDNSEIVIQTLDDFYESGGEYDLTEYVDISEKTVDKLHPFSDIELGFPEPSTFLTITRNRRLNNQFGFLSYSPNSQSSATNELFSGGKYTVEPKFEKMLFERLKNGNSSSFSPYVYGRFVDKKQDPAIGEPLIFFPKITDTGNVTYKFDGESASDIVSRYVRPSNSFSFSNTINFGTEIDEYYLYQIQNSLFERFYKKYISRVYNPISRKVKISAYLPMWFILNYELNDEVIINGRRFRINKLDVTLNDRSADMELINIPTEPLRIGDKKDQTPLARPTNIEAPTTDITANSFLIDWIDQSEFDDRIVEYNVYLDDVLKATISVNNPLRHQFTNLTKETKYNAKVLSVDADGNLSGTRLGDNEINVTTL